MFLHIINKFKSFGSVVFLDITVTSSRNVVSSKTRFKDSRYYFTVYNNILYILQYTSNKSYLQLISYQDHKVRLPLPRKILSSCSFLSTRAPSASISTCYRCYLSRLIALQFFSSKALEIYF